MTISWRYLNDDRCFLILLALFAGHWNATLRTSRSGFIPLHYLYPAIGGKIDINQVTHLRFSFQWSAINLGNKHSNELFFTFHIPLHDWDIATAIAPLIATITKKAIDKKTAFYKMAKPCCWACCSVCKNDLWKFIECYRETVRKKLLSVLIIFIMMESLILAQDERWRRGLGMQVER